MMTTEEAHPQTLPVGGKTRRSVLTGGLALSAALLLGLSRKAHAQEGGGGGNGGLGSDVTGDWQSLENRLARRVTYGLTAADAARANELGFQAYLDEQLTLGDDADADVEAEVAARYPYIFLPATEIEAKGITPPFEQYFQATYYRALNSNRQLYQRMVEFWSDHFSTYIYKTYSLQIVDDREVIRPNALGNFPDLLKASAHSGGMLVYLDNASSEGEHPNQNYAREIMELHTLGVKGGYTQQDVLEVARCFTGWSYEGDVDNPDYGQYNFYPEVHDDGEKIVLGNVIPAGGGESDGDRVLEILSNHPSTARFVGTKMLRWLLREDPTPQQIAAVADTYLQTGGDIKEMIRTILTPENLQDAPAKYKRPFHLVASAIRSTGATFGNLFACNDQASGMGMGIGDWAPPNGYPDAVGYWGGFIINRWNYCFDLARGGFDGLSEDQQNTIPGIVFDVQSWANLGSADAIVSQINDRFFGGELSDTLSATLTAYLQPADGNDAPTVDQTAEAVGLALASTEYQWY